jgi:hypothetical protein
VQNRDYLITSLAVIGMISGTKLIASSYFVGR